MDIKETIKKYKTLTGNYLFTLQAKNRRNENISSLVSISYGNNKMGKIPSVSLLPILSCPGRCSGTCAEKCYAKKLCNLRPTVLEAYTRNTAIYLNNPDSYFKAINKTMKINRYFRFHVSGDIWDAEYFIRMIRVIRKNPHCKVLVFTKKYEIVNDWIAKNGQLPENLCLLFSGWTNLKPDNPYNLPETTVYNTENEINSNWTLCGGNCLNCALHDSGCWTSKSGETIAFKIH